MTTPWIGYGVKNVEDIIDWTKKHNLCLGRQDKFGQNIMVNPGNPYWKSCAAGCPEVIAKPRPISAATFYTKEAELKMCPYLEDTPENFLPDGFYRLTHSMAIPPLDEKYRTELPWDKEEKDVDA